MPRDSFVAVKKMFLDRGKVINSMDRATKLAMQDFGRYVRADARQSIRKASKRTPPSTPPNPPRGRTGKLKRFIFYFYEPRRRNVVIGPALFARSRNDNLVMLEHGGRRRMRIPQNPRPRDPVTGRWLKKGAMDRDPVTGRYLSKTKRTANGKKARTVMKRAVYRARPFMQPAFKKNLPQAAQLFKDRMS